ncbi:MAG: ferritin family protein [Bacteroidetes bacterium]|nr:ferritin family protein [Bacteroidota bacterium]
MKEFTSINDILDFAIQAEQEAVDFYSMLSLNTSNQEMVDVFRQFAKEEMGHKARLLKIKEEGIITMDVASVQDLKIGDYLVDIQPTPDMGYQETLIVAMKKEKAAFKLYSNLAEKTPVPEIRNVFLSLAMEESKHKLRFELEYDEFILREN